MPKTHFRGVTFHLQSRKWKAQIKAGREIALGRYSDEAAAAQAYDRAAICARGAAAAKTNFPIATHYGDEVATLEATDLDTLAAQMRSEAPTVAGAAAGGTGAGALSRKTTSRFHGVRQNKRTQKFEAYVRAAGRHVHLGCFTREDDAGRAYDQAVLCRFLNPPGPPIGAAVPHTSSTSSAGAAGGLIGVGAAAGAIGKKGPRGAHTKKKTPAGAAGEGEDEATALQRLELNFRLDDYRGDLERLRALSLGDLAEHLRSVAGAGGGGGAGAGAAEALPRARRARARGAARISDYETEDTPEESEDEDEGLEEESEEDAYGPPPPPVPMPRVRGGFRGGAPGTWGKAQAPPPTAARRKAPGPSLLTPVSKRERLCSVPEGVAVTVSEAFPTSSNAAVGAAFPQGLQIPFGATGSFFGGGAPIWFPSPSSPYLSVNYPSINYADSGLNLAVGYGHSAGGFGAAPAQCQGSPTHGHAAVASPPASTAGPASLFEFPSPMIMALDPRGGADLSHASANAGPAGPPLRPMATSLEVLQQQAEVHAHAHAHVHVQPSIYHPPPHGQAQLPPCATPCPAPIDALEESLHPERRSSSHDGLALALSSDLYGPGGGGDPAPPLLSPIRCVRSSLEETSPVQAAMGSTERELQSLHRVATPGSGRSAFSPWSPSQYLTPAGPGLDGAPASRSLDLPFRDCQVTGEMGGLTLSPIGPRSMSGLTFGLHSLNSLMGSFLDGLGSPVMDGVDKME